MTVNFSKDSQYRSQINNKIVPYSSCNTTSVVMALQQAGWPLGVDESVQQPEDALTAFLSTPEAFSKQKEIAPWSVGAFRPQEVHLVLEWGVNAWMSRRVDFFTTMAKKADLLAHLESGGGVVLSGKFPMPSSELGHIVSLAGYEAEDDSAELSGWIVDDPYGNWHEQYRDHRGNNIVLTAEEFDRIFTKDSGYFWAHLIGRAA